MKTKHSNYPLGQLLITILKHSGRNLPQFLNAIGYRNVNKGIRAFQSFLKTGRGPSLLFIRIQASQYSPHPEALVMILHQNLEQLEQELLQEYGMEADYYHEDFRPFLHAVPALPNVETISLFAQSGEFPQYTITFQKNVCYLPQYEQHKMVRRKIRRHYQRSQGSIHFLGAISHYLYYHSWSEPPLAFSVKGELLGIADNSIVPRNRFDNQSRSVDELLLERVLYSMNADTLH